MKCLSLQGVSNLFIPGLADKVGVYTYSSVPYLVGCVCVPHN